MPDPELIDFDGDFRVNMYRNTAIDYSPRVNDRVNDKVNDREHQLLTLLREDPGCTVTHLAEKLCLSRKTVSGYLQKLQKKNIITRVGSSRRGYWNIVKTDGE